VSKKTGGALVSLLDSPLCGNPSTIFTSQLRSEKWQDHVGDPTIADAICDRLLHNVRKIDLKGQSRRKKKKTRSELLDQRCSAPFAIGGMRNDHIYAPFA